MKKFIFGFFTFGLLLITPLYALDIIISNGLKKSKSETYNTINKIVDGKINADIVINGSSKAVVQISPKIIDSILLKNSYNFGLDGNEFIPQLTQYELYREYNHKPKMIIQIVGNDFLRQKDELFNYMRFAPYLNLKGVKEMTIQYKGFSFIDYNIPLVKYSGYFGLVTDGLLSNFGINKQLDAKYKGYQEKNLTWNDSFDKFKLANPKGFEIHMSEFSKEKFKSYVAEIRKEKIEFIMVYPPTFAESQDLILNRSDIIDFYEMIANDNKVPFLNYSKHYISNDVQYFYNSQHLNKKGAEKFTRILANDIKLRLE